MNIFCNVFQNFSKSSLPFFPNGVRIIFIAPEEKSSPLVAVGSSRQMRSRRIVRTNSPLISIFGINFWPDSSLHWKVVTHFQCLCGGATSISGILKFVPHFEELWSWNFLWRSILISSSWLCRPPMLFDWIASILCSPTSILLMGKLQKMFRETKRSLSAHWFPSIHLLWK